MKPIIQTAGTGIRKVVSLVCRDCGMTIDSIEQRMWAGSSQEANAGQSDTVCQYCGAR